MNHSKKRLLVRIAKVALCASAIVSSAACATTYDLGIMRLTTGLFDKPEKREIQVHPVNGANAASQRNAPVVMKDGWPVSPNCKALSFVVPIDVDTAYARVMSKFNFATNEQMERAVAATINAGIDPSFKHNINRGSIYQMAQTIRYPSPTGDERRLQIEMVLTKEGKGTFVDIKYCTNPQQAGEDQPSYHDYLAGMFKNTFKARKGTTSAD